MRPKHLPDPRVWGQISALSMGAFVTIVCVAQSVDPFVILKRVVISSLAAGATSVAAVYCMTQLRHIHR